MTSNITQRVIYQILTLGINLVLFSSCIHNPDPSRQMVEQYYFEKKGDGQKAFANTYLEQPIEVINTFSSVVNGNEAEEFNVYFKVVAGGGALDDEHLIFKSFESITTNWRLGVDQTDQQAEATVFSSGGKLLATLRFEAAAFSNGRWDKVSFGPDNQITDLEIDSNKSATYMIAYGRLYKQGDAYFKWIDIHQDIIGNVHSVEIDSEGNIFLGAWSGELYKSADGGITYQKCATPIVGYKGHFELYLTNDDKLWVSRWDHALRYSSNGGQSWSSAQSGLVNNPQFNGVYRLSNGHYLTLSNADMIIYQSVDDGANWEAMTTPEGVLNFYVTDQDEIVLLTQADGLSIFLSSDMGENFELKYSKQVYYYTSPMKHIVNEHDGVYYLCLTGSSIEKTTDFEGFDVLWQNKNVRELWMDHDGVMMVSQLELGTVHYFR